MAKPSDGNTFVDRLNYKKYSALGLQLIFSAQKGLWNIRSYPRRSPLDTCIGESKKTPHSICFCIALISNHRDESTQLRKKVQIGSREYPL